MALHHHFNKNNFKKLLTTPNLIIALVVIGVLAIYSNFVFTIIHTIVNLFAGGRSFTKVFLFLAYLITLLLTVHLKIVSGNKWTIKAKQILIGLIAAVFLLNIGSFLWFANNFGFSAKDQIVTVNNGELSSTKLLHNHTIKGAVGAVLYSTSSSAAQENIDTGLPYVNLIPSWVYVLTIILTLLIFAGVSDYFMGTWQDQKRPVLYAVLYSIITFSLIKNIFDGGLLNHETIVSFAFFIYLLFHNHHKIKEWVLGILGTYIAVLILLYWYGFYYDFSEFSYGVYITITLTLILTSLTSLLSPSKTTRQTKLLIILTILMVYYPFAGDLSILVYRQKTISSDGALVALYKKPMNKSYKLVEQIDGLGIYSFHTNKPIKNSVILDENNLLDNFLPVGIPWKTCLPSNKLNSYDFTLSSIKPLSKKSIATENDNSKVSVRINPLVPSHGLNRYNVKLSFPQCWPREVNIIEEYFKAQGLKTFFITDLNIIN